MTEKLEALRTMIEAQQRVRLVAEGMSDLLIGTHYTGSIKVGRKYANIDFGGSGKYMVELSTGAIYGIKGYGVIHRGHYYGTLDTIADYDWSGYTAVKKQPVIALGDRVFYSGDMANESGWFTVASVRAPGCFDLVGAGDNTRSFIGVRHIGHKYAGHCDPRFVTETAYKAYREAIAA